MTTTRKCPQCGNEMAETTMGLCPACLMNEAMATGTNAGSVAVESPATQTINPELGTKIQYFGDYELLQEIARGGMGVIYQARQASLNRVVALKMILSGQLASEAEVQRFHVEAEAAANLQHPNIVAVHEVGVHDGRHYFTMDFVDGQNLAQLIGGRPLPAQRAAQYAKTIADAVHFAHQRGTLHRDLKPQNVMVDVADRVRITDFGLAKQLADNTRLTVTGAVMGSPNYMSPEQAQGRQDIVGPATDVYSLGAVLYEMLTGRPPFLAESPLATMTKVVEQDPIAPSKLNAAAPRDLETICLKCLEKVPLRRYATARELAEDLDRFLKQEPILARPASPVRKVEQWMRRHPLVLAAVAALAVLVLATLCYGLWQENQFLVWSNAHPGTERVAGPRTAFVKTLDDVEVILFVVAALTFVMTNKRLRGLPVKKLFDPNLLAAQTAELSSAGTLRAIEAIGASFIVCALFHLVKLIDAYVWEGYARQTGWGMIYAMLYFGGAMLLYVRRQRRIQLFGRSGIDPAHLPKELVVQIVAALRAGDTLQAFKLYRTATESTFAEAKSSIDRIAQEHSVTVPAAQIDGRRLIAGAATLVAAIVVVGYLVSPEWRWPLLAQFACGLAAGLTLTIGLRFKGPWKRMLVILLGLAMMIAAEAIFASGPSSVLAPMIGVFVGIAVVVSSYRRKGPIHATDIQCGGGHSV